MPDGHADSDIEFAAGVMLGMVLGGVLYAWTGASGVGAGMAAVVVVLLLRLTKRNRL